MDEGALRLRQVLPAARRRRLAQKFVARDRVDALRDVREIGAVALDGALLLDRRIGTAVGELRALRVAEREGVEHHRLRAEPFLQRIRFIQISQKTRGAARAHRRGRAADEEAQLGELHLLAGRGAARRNFRVAAEAEPPVVTLLVALAAVGLRAGLERDVVVRVDEAGRDHTRRAVDLGRARRHRAAVAVDAGEEPLRADQHLPAAQHVAGREHVAGDERPAAGAGRDLAGAARERRAVGRGTHGHRRATVGGRAPVGARRHREVRLAAAPPATVERPRVRLRAAGEDEEREREPPRHGLVFPNVCAPTAQSLFWLVSMLPLRAIELPAAPLPTLVQSAETASAVGVEVYVQGLPPQFAGSQ